MYRLTAVMLIGLLVGCGVSDEPRRAAAPDPTTTAPIPSVRDFDFSNRTYLLSCGGEMFEIPLVDGEWQNPEGPTMGTIDYFDVEFYEDVTGDGQEDAVLSVGCGVGAGTVTPHVLVMSSSRTGITQVGQNVYGFRPAVSDGGFTAELGYYEPTDGRCCPSSYDRTQYVLRNGGWSDEGTTRIPVGD